MELTIGDIKDIAVILATITGAIWALAIRKFYFEKLKIQAEEKKLIETEFKIKSLELEVKTQPIISINISIEQDADYEDNNYLVIEVVIENSGNENALIDHKFPPITISRVFYVDGDTQFGKPKEYNDVGLGIVFNKVQILRSQSSHLISIIHKIEKRGLYCIQYLAPISKRGQQIANETAIQNDENIDADFGTWKRVKYFNVKEIKLATTTDKEH